MKKVISNPENWSSTMIYAEEIKTKAIKCTVK